MARNFVIQISFWSVLTFLSSCASESVKKYSFSPSDEQGFVVFGVVSEVGGYMLSFDELTESGSLRREWTGRDFNNYRISSPNKKHYVMDRFGPGTYVLARYYFKTAPNRENIVLMRNGTIKFTVESGRIIYLGDITVGEKGCQFSVGSLSGVEKYLEKQPDVRGELGYEKPNRTVYRD